MRWRRRRDRPPVVARVGEPVVLTVTRPLTHETAADVAAQVRRVPEPTPVVVDLTGIPAFDTDGAGALLGLQDAVGVGRLSIVGFRQAVARIVGETDVPAASVQAASVAASPGWSIRRLRNLAVVHGAEDALLSAESLEPFLTAALHEDVGIVVADLRPVGELTPEAVQVVAFASSQAALRGQELLVVNVSAEAAEQLRRAGLSATTFIAPQPQLDNP